MTDLSKKPGTITYEYLQIIPKVYALQQAELDNNSKRDEALMIAIQALNNARTSKDTYERKRLELISAQTIEDIIRVLEKTIGNGKKYQD